MYKIIMVFLGLSFFAFGMSYKQFKKHTLKHAKILQSQTLNVAQVNIENTIALRTPNPSMDVEIGRYDEEFRDIQYGYSVFASQRVRTDSYLDALKGQSHAKVLLAKAYALDGKAKYIKKMEETYTQYVYQAKLLSLLKEEYVLSSKMSKVAKERYHNGAETRVSYLQAKTQTLALKTELHTTTQEMNSLYYTLLAIGGFSKKVILNKKFIYTISSTTSRSNKSNTQQRILLAKEKLYASQLQMGQNSFDAYDIIAGVEKEPEQSVLRVGISIPLPLRHNKEEERALSHLKMQQLKLDRGALSLSLKSQKRMIKSNLHELTLQHKALKVLKKEQQSLANLLTEGYEIAQGSLFELMNAKNGLIQTKKSLLNTQKMINIQKIAYHNLQGHYND